MYLSAPMKENLFLRPPDLKRVEAEASTSSVRGQSQCVNADRERQKAIRASFSVRSLFIANLTNPFNPAHLHIIEAIRIFETDRIFGGILWR